MLNFKVEEVVYGGESSLFLVCLMYVFKIIIKEILYIFLNIWIWIKCDLFVVIIC